MTFDITYEIITEESAGHGEHAEAGFREEGLSLRDAYNILRWEGHCEASDSTISTARWLTFYGDMDMQDGSYTNYSLHFPDKVTGSTRARIARLFGCK